MSGIFSFVQILREKPKVRKLRPISSYQGLSYIFRNRCNCQGKHPANFTGCSLNPLNKPPPLPKVNFWEEGDRKRRELQGAVKAKAEAATVPASPARVSTLPPVSAVPARDHTPPTSECSSSSSPEWGKANVEQQIEEFLATSSEERSDIEDFYPTDDANCTVANVRNTIERGDFCLTKIQSKKTEHFYEAETIDVKEYCIVEFPKNIARSNKFLYDKEETYEIDNRNIVFKLPKPQSVGASE
ncbi:hypothetical protein TNCV_4853651 [Trichonephila clavipes]|nr:hypothetical protein TNCV_4853651 [Trichonephila clavipes]